MPAKNPRINITMDKSIAALITQLAEREDISVSALTKELILEALERREDLALSTLATLRDKKQTKRIKHSNAWK